MHRLTWFLHPHILRNYHDRFCLKLQDEGRYKLENHIVQIDSDRSPMGMRYPCWLFHMRMMLLHRVQFHSFLYGIQRQLKHKQAHYDQYQQSRLYLH